MAAGIFEKRVGIGMPDGTMPVFFCHPKEAGPFPPVFMLMDAAGMRDELRQMAREFAARGFFMVLPDLYYRFGPDSEWTPEADEEGSAENLRLFERFRLMKTYMALADCAAILKHLDDEQAARPGPVGLFGFCMSGPFALAAAATFGARVTAAASVHGANMATDAPDSPHRLAPQIKAEVYMAWAEHDGFAPPQDREAVDVAFRAAGLTYEIDLHPGTEHGFISPRRPWFKPQASARVWEKLGDLFQRQLG
jgi:carboxymethylenebutenolidase